MELKGMEMLPDSENRSKLRKCTPAIGTIWESYKEQKKKMDECVYPVNSQM